MGGDDRLRAMFTWARTRERGKGMLWPWVSLLPFGIGAWAPVVAGVRCGVVRWALLGVFWAGVAVAGFVLVGIGGPHTAGAGTGSLFTLSAWVGGAVTSFSIRGEYRQLIAEIDVEPVRWPQPTLRSREWSVRYALAAYVATFAAAAAIEASLVFGVGVHVHVGVAVLITDMVLLVSLVPIALRRGVSAADLGLRETAAVPSVGLVAGAFAAYVLVAAAWAVLMGIHDAGNTFAAVRHQSSLNVTLAVLAAAASAPIVEEVFFRGLLYRSLRNRMAIAPAALVAGVLFGLVHIGGYPLVTLPVKAVFGVIACLLYERTGSLLPGIALHSMIDASGVEAALTGSVGIALGGFAMLGLLLLARGSARQLVARRDACVPRPSSVKPHVAQSEEA